MKKFRTHVTLSILLLALPQLCLADAKRGEIQHDAEHYMLLQQHAESWAKEDRLIDARLAEVRAKNGGKAPNVV